MSRPSLCATTAARARARWDRQTSDTKDIAIICMAALTFRDEPQEEEQAQRCNDTQHC